MTIFILNNGSETYKLHEDLKVSLHGEYKVWSTIYGAIFYRLFRITFIGLFTWMFIHAILTTKILFTTKYTQERKIMSLTNDEQ